MKYTLLVTKLCLVTLFSVSFVGAGDVILNGVGATFPYPLYQKWFYEYYKQKKVRIDYQAVGSGGGIKALLEERVDFGATDVPLADDELARAPGPIAHIPTCIGAVAIIYNLPGDPRIQLTSDLLAEIFAGRIQRWNDKKISKVNPGLQLPNIEIAIVHRSESSGTSGIFTEYLSKISSFWRTSVGHGKTVRWPSGVGVERNQGVADFVRRVEGAIGYVEMTYALSNQIPMAAIRNRSGTFVKPSIESASQAGDVAFPADGRISITDTPSPSGYPISSFTYIIYYADQAYGGRTRKEAPALGRFLLWAVNEGQLYAKALHYAPLPPRAAGLARKTVRSMTIGKTPLFGTAAAID